MLVGDLRSYDKPANVIEAETVGRRIRFNPATEEIYGDPAASALLGRAKREPWNIL